MAIEGYKLVVSNDPDALERKVLALAAEGYDPEGAAVFGPDRNWCQAMIKGSNTLPDDAAAVEDGDTFALGDATITAAVAANVATFSLPGTNAVVEDGQNIAVTGGTVTLSVAGGVVTAAYTPD